MNELNVGRVPILNLSGERQAMGHEHGETFRSEIHDLAAIRLDLLKRSARLRSEAQIQRLAEGLANEVRLHTPHTYAETQATAEAASLPYWKLIVAGGFSDVADLLSRRAGEPNRVQECTVIAVANESLGNVIVGSWDTHATAVDSLVLIRRQPRNACATLALTTAGWPMQQGITLDGYGYAIANLVGRSSGKGLTYIAALPEAVSASSVTDAANRLQSYPHASARFYLLCGARDVRSLEVTPQDGTTVETGPDTAHTNHFVYRAELEGRPDSNDSQSRFSRALPAIAELKLSKSADDMISTFMRFGLVQRGAGDADRTGVVFVLVPRDRRIHFATDVHSVPAEQTSVFNCSLI